MLVPSIFSDNFFDDFFEFPFIDDRAEKNAQITIPKLNLYFIFLEARKINLNLILIVEFLDIGLHQILIMLVPSIFSDNFFDDFFEFPFIDDRAEKNAERKLYGHHASN